MPKLAEGLTSTRKFPGKKCDSEEREERWENVTLRKMLVSQGLPRSDEKSEKLVQKLCLSLMVTIRRAHNLFQQYDLSLLADIRYTLHSLRSLKL